MLFLSCWHSQGVTGGPLPNTMPDSDLDLPPGKAPLTAEEIAETIHLPLQARDSP
jgi:hypothetical protein